MALKTIVVLAALSAAVAADNGSRSIGVTSRHNLLGLAARQECEVACGPGCMPTDASCCSEIEGAYCTAGTVCSSATTCCPEGQTCDDEAPPTGCNIEGYVLCGNVCIHPDEDCEPTGTDPTPGLDPGNGDNDPSPFPFPDPSPNPDPGNGGTDPTPVPESGGGSGGGNGGGSGGGNGGNSADGDNNGAGGGGGGSGNGNGNNRDNGVAAYSAPAGLALFLAGAVALVA